MDTGTPEVYFRALAPITRFFLTATFGVTLITVLGIFNISFLSLDWTLVWKKFHLWRLITDYIFVGRFSFGWLFHMYFFLTFSSKLERHQSFSPSVVGRGGYLYFLFLQMISLDIVSLLLYYPTGEVFLGLQHYGMQLILSF